MNKHSYNYGQPVQKMIVPTLAETMNLIDKLKRSKKLFRVDFLKRTTGEMRTMVCRFGVTKHLKGGKRAYDFGDKGLLSVYDINKQGYRSIPIDNITLIKSAGIVYRFEKGLPEGHYHAVHYLGRTVPSCTSPLYKNIEGTVGAS